MFSPCRRIAIRSSGPGVRRDAHTPLVRIAAGQGPEFDWVLDLSNDTLRIKRGHVGRAGIFLFQAAGVTIATSRLSDLLASAECRIDYGSALHYLTFGTPSPGHSLVDGVQALPAGHAITLKPGAVPVRTRTFEILSHTESSAPDIDGTSAIATAVDRAIVHSCGEEGGIALLLSAGVDSSYVAAVLGNRIEACYTSFFPDIPQPGEFEDARLFSQITGHTHHAVPIAIPDARKGLERVLGAEEPRSAWSTIVHDSICQAVGGNGQRRLLSGLGADEVFGGYFHYAHAFGNIWQQALRLDPEQVRNPLETILGSPRWYRERLFTGIPLFVDTKTSRKALLPPWRHWDSYQSSVHFYLDLLSRKPDIHLFEAMIAHEAQHRVPDLLVRGFEAISGENGLTSGFPFLDPDVMRKGAALGAELRFRKDRTTGTTLNKLLWREIASRRLPDFVMMRPPTAYDAPIHYWFADGAFLDTICDAIRLPSLLDLGLFSRTWIDGLVDALRAMRGRPDPRANAALAEQAWIVATFSAWQERVLDVR